MFLLNWAIQSNPKTTVWKDDPGTNRGWQRETWVLLVPAMASLPTPSPNAPMFYRLFNLPLGSYCSVCHPHSRSHHSDSNCAKIGNVILNHNHYLSLVLKNMNYFHTLSLFFEAINHLALSCDNNCFNNCLILPCKPWKQSCHLITSQHNTSPLTNVKSQEPSNPRSPKAQGSVLSRRSTQECDRLLDCLSGWSKASDHRNSPLH